MKVIAGALILCGTLAAVDVRQRGAAAGNVTRGCVDRFDAAADYFPDKVMIDDATNFSVEYRKSYKVITVREPYAGGPPEQYALVMCGTPVPPLLGPLAGAQVVVVPITSMFALSTTHLPLLAHLDRLDVLTGIGQANATTSPEVQARTASGRIVEFARAGPSMDVERVVTSRPSLLMAGASANATLSVIRTAGIPVVANTEWLESTALARAEWLKYMALFLNEERKAQAVYGDMKGRYRSFTAETTTVPEHARPLVMTGRSRRGTFTIAGGRSYVAALIQDAGGRYAWADNTSTGSATVDLEAQLQRAANADVWINGGGWATLAAMLEDEPRYAAFKAYRDGLVWVYERRITPGGANDYWAESITRPDLVLADLVKIFHPDRARDHEFQWYMRVPSK
jgi:iron complex transport system substrate-binding protein